MFTCVMLSFSLWMHACFCCFRFSFFSIMLSDWVELSVSEIADFSVEWDTKYSVTKVGTENTQCALTLSMCAPIECLLLFVGETGIMMQRKNLSACGRLASFRVPHQNNESKVRQTVSLIFCVSSFMPCCQLVAFCCTCESTDLYYCLVYKKGLSTGSFWTVLQMSNENDVR